MTHKRNIFITIATLTVALMGGGHTGAQEATKQKEIVVTNSKTGPIFALAELTLREYRRGDYATASTLAEILNRVWNNSESVPKDGLFSTNLALWRQIDDTLDRFRDLVEANNHPKIDDVQPAYDTLVAQLKKVD